MQSTHESKLDGALNVVTLVLFWLGGLLAAFSAYLTASYIFRGLTADGVGGGDYLIGIGCWLACFSVLVAYHYIGTHVLPNLPKGQRALPVTVFAATAVLVFALSTISNFLEVTRAPVEVAEQIRLRETAQERYSQSAKAAREVEILIPVIRAGKETSRGLLDDETGYGAICGQGSGVGTCASELRNLVATLAETETSLINAAADTKRLTRRGANILEDISRVSSHPDLDWHARDTEIKSRLKDLSLVADEINQLLPVSAVVSIVDAMQKPWAQIGFSPEGAAKMAGTFTPIATRLNENTRDLRAVKYRTVIEAAPKTGLSAAIAHMDKVGVQAALAILLDTLPLFAILILLVVQWGRRDRADQPDMRITLLHRDRKVSDPSRSHSVQ